MPEGSRDLVGQTIADRYRLIRVLGRGGMGEVYEAVDPEGRPFALKVIHRDLVDKEILARFLREGMLTKTVSSPHVLPVVDVGHDPRGNVPFIVMPLLHGRDLAAVLHETGAMDPRAAVRIARQACAGLTAVHRAGVIHRDLKPSNLFVEDRPGDEVVVRLMDFGIGKRIGDGQMTQLTATGRSIGSPLYMSPEQIRSSKHVDARTDVYGLGVVLYEMLAGDAPWAALVSFSEVMVAVSTLDAPDLLDRSPWVDAQLALVVHQALSRDPARRFPTAEAFGEALAPFAGGGDQIARGMLIPIPDHIRGTVSRKRSGLSEKPTEVAFASEQDPLIGHRLGGEYPVVRLLGRGGMGAVYEVTRPDGTRAAAKVISAEVTGHDQQKIRRFLREARAAKSIESPNVVRTIELGTDSKLDAPFIIMELLQGVDLATLIRERAPLEPSAIASIGIDAARGLAAAHAQGVVHRDVKPANLFLQASSESEPVTVKVCDFGIAKRLDELGGEQTSAELTRTGGMLGSPMYMSPEQVKSAKNVDQRSDVWSLCVTLYEALAGRRPWQEYSTLGEIIVAICTEPVPRLESVAPWVDSRLAQAVHRGLERDPGKRWQSMTDLVAALASIAPSRTPTLAELQRVSDDRLSLSGRVIVSSRPDALLSASIAEGATLAATESRTLGQPAPKRRSRAAIVAAALLGVAGVGVAVTLVVTSKGPPPERDREAVASAEPRATAARVAITPPEAEVTVDGKPSPPRGGEIELGGQPGDSFEVRVAHAGQERRERVVITKDGTASPARIEVATGPVPVVTGSGAAPAPSSRVTAKAAPARKNEPLPKPAHSAPSTKPPESPKPAAAPSPTVVGPKENW